MEKRDLSGRSGDAPVGTPTGALAGAPAGVPLGPLDGSTGGVSGVFEEAPGRFASAPTQDIPVYPSAPPAGDVAGETFAAPPGLEAQPLASFAPPRQPGAQSVASAFLAHATRVPTFAEGPLPPGCDDLAGLRASLLALGLDRTPATIMVAGASLDEATTAVAVGLAGELARDLSHQVLLVDANVARPGAMRMLDVDPALELADVLEGRVFAGEAIVHSETDNLSVLALRPDPVIGRSRATAESFLGDVARQVIAELQAAFDYVVVDAGAVETSAVPRVLAARATGTLLVLARGVSREQASGAKRVVEGGGGRVLGVVLAGGRGVSPRGRASGRGAGPAGRGRGF